METGSSLKWLWTGSLKSCSHIQIRLPGESMNIHALKVVFAGQEETVQYPIIGSENSKCVSTKYKSPFRVADCQSRPSFCQKERYSNGGAEANSRACQSYAET